MLCVFIFPFCWCYPYSYKNHYSCTASCCHCVRHCPYTNVCTVYLYKWKFWNFRLTGVIFSHYNWIYILFPLCHWFSGYLFTAIILKLSRIIIQHVRDYVCCNYVIINSTLFYLKKCPIWVIHFVVPQDIISFSSFSHASWPTII